MPDRKTLSKSSILAPSPVRSSPKPEAVKNKAVLIIKNMGYSPLMPASNPAGLGILKNDGPCKTHGRHKHHYNGSTAQGWIAGVAVDKGIYVAA